MELPDFPAGNGTGDPNDLHWAQVLAMLLVSEAEQASALDEPTRSGVIDQLRAQGSALPNLLRARQLIPAVEFRSEVVIHRCHASSSTAALTERPRSDVTSARLTSPRRSAVTAATNARAEGRAQPCAADPA